MKYSLILACLFSFFYATGQTYKPFRVELGSAIITVNASDNGSPSLHLDAYVEPRYAINDRFLVGFRHEKHLSTSLSLFLIPGEYEIFSGNSFLVEYFFNNKRTRPFAGVAFGVYHLIHLGADPGIFQTLFGFRQEYVSNVGIAPRVGINSGHFRLTGIFNFTGVRIKNYFGLNLGFEIGGGPVKGKRE